MIPEQSFVGWTRDLQKLVMEKTMGLGQQLANWLVIGNAGALVLAFNGMVQGSTCDLGTMQTAMTYFAGGLGAAFTAGVVGYFSSINSLLFLTNLNTHAETMWSSQFHIRELAEKGQESAELDATYDRAGQAITTAKNRLLWVGPIVSMLLYIGSIAAFTLGATAPIRQSAESLAACSAKSRAAPALGLAPARSGR